MGDDNEIVILGIFITFALILFAIIESFKPVPDYKGTVYKFENSYLLECEVEVLNNEYEYITEWEVILYVENHNYIENIIYIIYECELIELEEYLNETSKKL